MKLSTKGRYGLRAMIDMALSEDNTPIATRCIAETGRIIRALFGTIDGSSEESRIDQERARLPGGIYISP